MEKDQDNLIPRLNIIRGQIDGLSRLIKEKPEDCQGVLNQFKAVNSALKKVTELYVKRNVNACLRAVRLKDKKTINVLIEKLIQDKK